MKRKALTVICALALLSASFPGLNALAAGEFTDPMSGESPAASPEVSDVPAGADEPYIPTGTEEPVVPTGNEGAESPVEPTETPAPTDEEVTSGNPEETVLVGLFYGSTALDGANLQNSVGSGYRFGYLDGERNFQSLGYTAEENISVVMTQNVWYGTLNGYTSYFRDITSDILVGCFHVGIPTGELATFEDALALAGTVGGFPAWIGGRWEVRYGSYATKEEAQNAALAMGGTLAETSSYGVSVVLRGTSKILFQFDGGQDISLMVKPGLDDTQKAVTWFKNNRHYGGFQYRRIGGGPMTVSSVLSLDDYVECVISREMSSSWPLEALKAQAICARNYYDQNHSKTSSKHRAQGFDLCSTTDCQVYYGMGSTNERTAQAVRETSKLRIYYGGEQAEVYYFSSDGGATEDVRNVWSSSPDHPYLCGVIDPYEATVADQISGWQWTRTFTATELTAKLQSKGYGNSQIVDFRITATTPTGNVKSIAFIDTNGKSWPFTKEKVRTFLSLKSIRYSVSKAGETVGGGYYTVGSEDMLPAVEGTYAMGGDGSIQAVSGTPYIISASGIDTLPPPYGGTSTGEIIFTVQGAGWGHNIGMSQWGAYAMAQQGRNFEEILKFYFPGVEIY